MSLFPSLSAWFRSRSSRERRVVAGGALAVGLILACVWGALPLLRRWQDREAAIDARRGQLGRLHQLLASEAALRRGLDARQQDQAVVRARLLPGATPALAASNLQALLQGYADASRVTLDRVDLVADSASAREGGLPAIPVQLSASGDIYGLAELLARLQYGRKLLVIDELRVNAGALGGTDNPLLTWTVRLHGAYGAE